MLHRHQTPSQTYLNEVVISFSRSNPFPNMVNEFDRESQAQAISARSEATREEVNTQKKPVTPIYRVPDSRTQSGTRFLGPFVRFAFDYFVRCVCSARPGFKASKRAQNLPKTSDRSFYRVRLSVRYLLPFVSEKSLPDKATPVMAAVRSAEE